MNKKATTSKEQIILYTFLIVLFLLLQVYPVKSDNLNIVQSEKYAFVNNGQTVIPDIDYSQLHICYEAKYEQEVLDILAQHLPSYRIDQVSSAPNEITKSIQMRANPESTSFDNTESVLDMIRNYEAILAAYPVILLQSEAAVTNNKLILNINHYHLYQAEILEITADVNAIISDQIHLGQSTTLILQLPASTSVFESSCRFSKFDHIQYAQPNFIFKGMNHFVPDDPMFNSQWFLHNENDTDIDATEAWNITRGADSIAIAVIDGHGYDLEHIEMESKYANPYCAVNDNNDPSAMHEDENHGTPCAGLIGALTNNDLGVASLGYKCSVIPIRIGFDFNGAAFTTSSEIIQRAASHVINSKLYVAAVSNSFGLGAWANNDAVRDAFESMRTQTRDGLGAVILASTGNDGESGVKQYPCFFANVIGVGASNSLDQRVGSSNHGDSCDLVAPGANLYTLDRSGDAGYDPGYYTTFSGTSAACPLTAALAGLVVSLHPDWNSTDVMKKICYACEEVGDYTYELGTLYPYGKWNEEMGYGRINAHYALQGGSVSFEPPSNFTSSVNGNHVLLEWDLPSGGSTNEEWLKYHDGSIEDSFASTNGGMGIAQRFTAPAAYLKLDKIRYYTSNFQNYDSYNEIFVLSGNGSEVLAGPYYRQGKANGWISLDLSDIIINASSFMVATYNTDPNGPFVGADNSHYNGSLYFGNHTEGFDELGVLGYQYVGSHEAYVEYSAKSGEVIKSILKPTAQQVTANKLQRSGGFINYRLEKNIHPKKTGARNLLGYNVFRNGDEINQEIITETTYQDNALNAGNYSYSITAVYDEGESRHSDTLEVTIQQGDFTPPTSLVAFNNNENVELYWKSPGGFGGVEWIAYHDNSFENSICSVNGNMGLAQKFHLDYHPANLKAVRFFVENYGNWDGEIEVYILRPSGNNVIAGPYVVDGEAGSWITIENEGVTINEASFMVATYNTEPNGPYISTDMNNYKASLYFGNHYEGFMELGQDEFFAVGSHEALVEYLNKDGNVITEVIGWKPGETVKTVQAERSLEHYSVYRDQQFLTTTNTTHAEDILPAFGTYEYSVTASYEEGESEATGSVAVTWESGYGIDENEISLNTSLFPNPGKDIFYMKSYQEITMIRILNVSGKIIYRMQLQEREAMLDLSMLKAGVYFLYFQSEEETGIKKLIVK